MAPPGADTSAPPHGAGGLSPPRATSPGSLPGFVAAAAAAAAAAAVTTEAAAVAAVDSGASAEVPEDAPSSSSSSSLLSPPPSASAMDPANSSSPSRGLLPGLRFLGHGPWPNIVLDYLCLALAVGILLVWLGLWVIHLVALVHG